MCIRDSIVDAEKKLQIMAGLVSMLATDPGLADAVNQAIVEPRASVNLSLIHISEPTRLNGESRIAG